MGPSGISIWQLLIILMIVLLLFGTKRLRSIGADLGDAVRGFRNSLREDDNEETADAKEAQGLEHKQESPNKAEKVSQKSQSDTDFKQN
jgi:sec-independent protein translocase protein TatA